MLKSWLLVVTVAAMACGGNKSACIEGQSSVCACATGGTGAQVCTNGAFGACSCATGTKQMDEAAGSDGSWWRASDSTQPASSAAEKKGSSNSNAARPTPTTQRNSSVSTAQIEAVMTQMQTFKNELCDCGDKGCADRVTSQMADWSRRQSQNVMASASADQTKQMKDIGARMTECAKRLATTGQVVINDFRQLKENEQLMWRMAPGRYHVRATASNSGMKVKWVGAECPPSKGEVKVYDENCFVAAESQLVIENPGGLTGLGPTEQISVSATTL